MLNQKTWWEKAEVIARLVSAIAIPLAVVVIGSAIQRSIAERSTAAQYVELAVSLLQYSDTAGISSPLREWATDLLVSHSPTPLDEDLQFALRTGLASLRPNGLSEYLSSDALTLEITNEEGYVDEAGTFHPADSEGVRDSAPPALQDQFALLVSVINHGPSTAQGVVVSGQLLGTNESSEIGFADVRERFSSQGDITLASRILNWKVGNLESGSGATLIVDMYAQPGRFVSLIKFGAEGLPGGVSTEKIVVPDI